MKNTSLILTLSSFISFGQMAPPDANANSIGMGTILPSSFESNYNPGGGFSPHHIEIAILDSPFVNNSYKTGKTTIHEKSGFAAKMRYNAAKEVVEFIDEDGTVKELLRRPYVTAEFDGKKYVILDYIDNNTKKEKLGYFNPLNNGNTQLLFMPKKKLELSDYAFQQRSDGYYYDASAYFIKKEGKPASRIVLNKMAILKNLDTKYEKILNYFILENDLDLRKEKDAVRLLDYYNAMIFEPEKIEEQS